MVELLLMQKAEVRHNDLELSPLLGATTRSHQVYDKSAMLRYQKCVTYLLQAGINPNAIDKQGRSALSWSTQPTQLPILNLLIRAGADPNVPDQQLKLPLHYAAAFARSQEIVRALIAKTVDPNSLDARGTSALTCALSGGDCPSIELLVHTTSNLNLGGGSYGCPLAAASRYYCSSKNIKLLLKEGADPNVLGGHYHGCIAALLRRPFGDLISEDDLLCLELLLSNGAEVNLRMNDGQQALHTAATYWGRRSPEIFETLLRYGADVNAIFQSSQRGIKVATTPLGIICHFHIKEKVTMVLLKAGADPNCCTQEGDTVLQVACNTLGSSKVAQELIRRGANVRTLSLKDRDTALHRAATAARSDVIRVLINRGADVTARDIRKRTPLHNACWRRQDKTSPREDFENPFEARGHLNASLEESEHLQSIRILIKLGHADIKAKDENGATPLHHAVKACNAMTVRTLIDLTSIDIILEKGSEGKLALHWAAEAGFTDGIEELVVIPLHIKSTPEGFISIEEWKELTGTAMEYVNTQDVYGNTALHYAAMRGHEEFVAKFLLYRGFTAINACNHKGYTALDLAKRNDQAWVIMELKEKGKNR